MMSIYQKILNAKFNPKILVAIFAFAIIYSLSGGIAIPSQANEAVSAAAELAAEEAAADTEGVSQSNNENLAIGSINMLEGVDSLEDIFGSGTSGRDSADYAIANLNAAEAVAASGAYEATEWNEADCPNYYRVDGAAIISYDVRSENGGIVYSGIDGEGRTTWAAGYITSEMRASAKARGRQEFDADCDKISGWGNNAKVSIPSANGSKNYNGYMFNRSHLIADSLGGAPIRENLVTGTRCQNVGNSDNKGGMEYAEEMARNYLDSHRGGYVYYAATPIYVGDEQVPRSVYVDIRSDDGSIDQHIEVYNVAKGYEIDYMTGNFS